MDELVFNRTIDDVLNHTEIGEYKYTDLNRVETWCDYLANKLTSYSYPVSIVTKTNWTMSDRRRSSQMERIRKNIKAIAQVFYSFTQIAPSVTNFDFSKANNWEQILYEIDSLLNNMIASFLYSGTFYSGESEGLLV